MKSNFKKYISFSFAVLLFTFFISSCISSLLKEKIPAFSNDIVLSEPSSPFKQIKSVAYPSWKNTSTQNVILIISNCEDSKYPTSHAYMTISENIENPKIEPSKIERVKLSQINESKFTTKQIHGAVDDSAVEIQTAAFQYHNCVYLSALSGRPDSIAKDFETWRTFLNSIEFKK